MDISTSTAKVTFWIVARLADRIGTEARARRGSDSARVRRALFHSVRRGAERAVWEVYGDDRSARKRARRALLRRPLKDWPLLDRTLLEDLPGVVRSRVRACALPEVPTRGVQTEDHPIVVPWCRGILLEVEREATRGAGVLGNMWTAFKSAWIVPATAASEALALPPSPERQISIAPPYGKADRRGRVRGRGPLIDAISADMGRAGVHILVGPGGFGKTRIALEIARQAERSGRKVWWVAANRINSTMREVNNQLGVPGHQIDQAWAGRASMTDLTWRSLNAEQDPWLLVFDNVDDPSSLDPAGVGIADGTGWLREPHHDAGSVIVTSRDRNPDTWGSWSSVHQVEALDSESGAQMLMDLTERPPGEFAQARELAKALGGMPLALWAAAKYLRSANTPHVWTGTAAITDFASYLRRVEQWLASPSGLQGGGTSVDLGLEQVQQAMTLSLELLEQRVHPRTSPLLRTLALGNAPIPYAVLLDPAVLSRSPLFAAVSEEEVGEMLKALADIGLVDLHELDNIADPELSHVLSIHPVFQGALRESTETDMQAEAYFRLQVDLLESALHESDPDLPGSWQLWYALAPHALEMVNKILLGGHAVSDSGLIRSAIELARRAARWLIVTNLFNPADDLVKPLIDRCGEFGFGRDDPEILGLRHEHGRIVLERGAPETAERELARVIELRTSLLGRDHPDTLASRHKHARAILEQARWSEAEELLASIVQAENDNEIRGPEHSDTMVVRHSLARSILYQRRYPEAEVMLKDILEVMDRCWPRDKPETLWVRQSLAVSLYEQERWDEAAFVVAEALSDAREHPESPMCLALRHQQGVVLQGQGFLPEALSHLTALHRDEVRLLGDAHITARMTANQIIVIKMLLTEQ
ncbi:NB-ARC domain-containing protein [Glycomyces luteolus]|uniref:NB-ARC domain-containing protein n=1 Tax=Glycomyces luteolus TaxID=2670330 RepID=A0A9X3PBT0_9ACTN|nr:tetratricopeptide repeat protein [Glycomyces luteolus]MDA1362152.1 NB-ARC domain-containing protein [Glycomyces luteolus]